MIDFTKDNFSTETSEGLVLVDFWAEWCGPCQAMMPIIEQFETETGIKVGKINVDNEQELAMEYRVMSIPTLVLMKDGKMVDQKIGAQTLDNLKAFVESHK